MKNRKFIDRVLITDFPGELYKVLKPFRVIIRDLGEQGVGVAWEEGNIAWVDGSRFKAVNGLKAEILDTLESYEASEATLGPEPKRQLAVLRTHLKYAPGLVRP